MTGPRVTGRPPDKKEPGHSAGALAGPGTADANNVHADSSKVIVFARDKEIEPSSPALCSGKGQLHSPSNKTNPQPLPRLCSDLLPWWKPAMTDLGSRRRLLDLHPDKLDASRPRGSRASAPCSLGVWHGCP